MYMTSYAVPVNPPGEACVLSQDELWAALAMKAENALPFVPGMTECRVIDRGWENGQLWVLRDVASMGREFQERVLLRAPTQVHFTLVDGGGFIENTISNSDDGLQLAFTFGIIFPDLTPGSPEERAKGESMKSGQVGAVAATLARARDLKRAGVLGQGS